MAALALFVQILVIILIIAVFLRVIFSWIAIDPGNPLYTIVHEVTEPILAPIRQFLPNFGGLDLSPMAASFILIIILRASLAIN